MHLALARFLVQSHWSFSPIAYQAISSPRSQSEHPRLHAHPHPALLAPSSPGLAGPVKMATPKWWLPCPSANRGARNSPRSSDYSPPWQPLSRPAPGSPPPCIPAKLSVVFLRSWPHPAAQRHLAAPVVQWREGAQRSPRMLTGCVRLSQAVWSPGDRPAAKQLGGKWPGYSNSSALAPDVRPPLPSRAPPPHNAAFMSQCLRASRRPLSTPRATRTAATYKNITHAALTHLMR